MPHDLSLIATITMGLVLAFFGGLVAHTLRLPPLVGYLLAGVALGPFTPGFVGDANLAGQLAEIGVILLMFGVGLHFSIKDLLAVRAIALPGAIAQIAVATASGVALALLWGWGVGAGLVLGLALSVASTVVLLRALEQRNALDTVNGRIAVGWLIVEDLVMVLALVLLPALAAALSGDARGIAAQFAGGSVATAFALTIGKVALFVAFVFLVGTRAVPWLLQVVARTGSRELFTLSVLAIALGIAYGSAELFGVSFALGAFFAGVVLSESDFSHQAAADSLPLQDAFAVLFFVSVGMLFDPGILVRQPLPVLAVVMLIVFGKSIAAFAIVIARGYPVTTALTVSASLAQIGEFSFILAGLGVTLGLLPPEGRDLILAGAILSITLNPLVFATVDPVAAWIRARPRLNTLLKRSGDPLATLPEKDRDTGWRDHAIIVGYGRVGEIIGGGLKAQGFPFVVVDEDRRRVEELRKHGLTAIYGDATAAGVLEAAGVDRARLLILAVPQGFQKRRIIELARQANPNIETAVRTHRASEVAYLRDQGVGLAIMGTREVAFGLLRYALSRFGLPDDRVQAIVQTARASGEGGAFEREPDIELPDAIPELRERSDDHGRPWRFQLRRLDELGVVTRFGKVTRQEPAGLHFRMPYPIDQVHLPKVTRQNIVEIGVTTRGLAGGASSVREEGLMLTGDENIVDVTLVVLWRIEDALKYLFNIRNPDTTVQEVAESAMREVVGRSDLQPILTVARLRTEQAAQKLMQDVLDRYGAGIRVDRVQLLKSDPPTQVIDAFRDVQAAATDKETLQNQAFAYAGRIVPEGRGEAEAILQRAKGYRQQTVAEATGQAARFVKVLDGYTKAPDVTRKRLYLETMERVFGSADIIIDSNGVVPLLPLGPRHKR